MKQMPVLSFERLNESVTRTLEVVDEVIRKQGDATVVVIQPDGTRVVTTLAQLHGVKLRDCLLLLPSDRGGLSGGMFAVENLDAVELDIAELPHKHHKARVRYIE